MKINGYLLGAGLILALLSVQFFISIWPTDKVVGLIFAIVSIFIFGRSIEAK